MLLIVVCEEAIDSDSHGGHSSLLIVCKLYQAVHEEWWCDQILLDSNFRNLNVQLMTAM